LADWPNRASELERRIELARQRLAARAFLVRRPRDLPRANLVCVSPCFAMRCLIIGCWAGPWQRFCVAALLTVHAFLGSRRK
jgi:hypothetical protein